MALNMSLVRNRRKQIQKQEEDRKNGKNFDALTNGKNKRRVMPPWAGSEDWRKYAAYHFNVLEKQAVLCPKKTFNKPCPICDYNEELYKSNDPADKEEAKKVRAKDRFYCNVLNLDKNDSKVYVMSFGQTIEEQIINIIDPGGDDESSEDTFGKGDITDPKSGFNLLITKTVPSDPTQTSYDVKCANDPSPVANWAEVEKQLINLDELIAKDEYTVEQLQGMLEGTYTGRNTSDSGSTPAPASNSTPATDEFGTKSEKKEDVKKTEVKQEPVSDEFEKPKDMSPKTEPAKQETVANSQPEKTMSAIDRLKARKAQQGAK